MNVPGVQGWHVVLKSPLQSLRTTDPIVHIGQHSPAADLYSLGPQAFPNGSVLSVSVQRSFSEGKTLVILLIMVYQISSNEFCHFDSSSSVGCCGGAL